MTLRKRITLGLLVTGILAGGSALVLTQTRLAAKLVELYQSQYGAAVLMGTLLIVLLLLGLLTMTYGIFMNRRPRRGGEHGARDA